MPGANEPLGRVSRNAESSLKEASLAEASEFKVPSKWEKAKSGRLNQASGKMRKKPLEGGVGSIPEGLRFGIDEATFDL